MSDNTSDRREVVAKQLREDLDWYVARVAHKDEEIASLKGEIASNLTAYQAALDMVRAKRDEVEKLNAVASERWHELKAAEKLIRQLEKALKGVLFVAKSEPGPVHSRLRRDIREAERVLEIVASRKRAKRTPEQ
jgi:vacuolar-type H+-ATPase subunit I/STV1